eukprot:9452815-Pyramimonas_sp.AAC.1
MHSCPVVSHGLRLTVGRLLPVVAKAPLLPLQSSNNHDGHDGGWKGAVDLSRSLSCSSSERAFPSKSFDRSS